MFEQEPLSVQTFSNYLCWDVIYALPFCWMLMVDSRKDSENTTEPRSPLPHCRSGMSPTTMEAWEGHNSNQLQIYKAIPERHFFEVIRSLVKWKVTCRFYSTFLFDHESQLRKTILNEQSSLKKHITFHSRFSRHNGFLLHWEEWSWRNNTTHSIINKTCNSCKIHSYSENLIFINRNNQQ